MLPVQVQVQEQVPVRFSGRLMFSGQSPMAKRLQELNTWWLNTLVPVPGCNTEYMSLMEPHSTLQSQEPASKDPPRQNLD